MGDYTSTSKSTKDLLSSLSLMLPSALQSVTAQTPGVAQTQLGIDQSMVGPYNELYKQGQLGSSETEAAVAQGPGQKLVDAADTYQKQLDPEFYKSRGLVSDALGKYLGASDPTSLTPTEEAQISRGINATTGPVAPSSMNTIRNAQTFGSAGTQRWQNFGDAVTKASATLPSLKSGISGFNTATTRGANPLPTTGANALDKGFGFASSALGNTTQLAGTSLGKEKTIPDQMSSAASGY